MRRIKSGFHFIFLFIMCVTLCRCGAESTGDTVARQRNRDQEAVNFVADEYKKVAGTYQGSTSSSDIYLVLASTKVIKEGTTVGQPSLAGSLVISPRISLALGNRPLQSAFPFYDGMYDKNSADLTFTVEKGGVPSEIQCKVAKKGDLSCTWFLRTSQAEFVLKKSNAKVMKVLSQQSAADSIYTGETNDGLSVFVQLTSGMMIREGSQIPEPSLMGVVTFYDKGKAVPAADDLSVASNSVKSGTYDIFTDSVTLLFDDDTRLVMNCEIQQSGKKLKCKWYSRSPKEFTVTRTTRH